MTKATALAASRWVTGIPAYALAATPAVTPGHDLEGDPVRAQGLGLLAAAPEHERVPALEADHLAPGRAVLDQQASISACPTDGPPPSLPA